MLTRERRGAEFSIRLTRVFAEDVAKASDIHSMVQNVRDLVAKWVSTQSPTYIHIYIHTSKHSHSINQPCVYTFFRKSLHVIPPCGRFEAVACLKKLTSALLGKRPDCL